MVFCGKCGTQCPSGKYCTSCGSPLAVEDGPEVATAEAMPPKKRKKSTEASPSSGANTAPASDPMTQAESSRKRSASSSDPEVEGAPPPAPKRQETSPAQVPAATQAAAKEKCCSLHGADDPGDYFPRWIKSKILPSHAGRVLVAAVLGGTIKDLKSKAPVSAEDSSFRTFLASCVKKGMADQGLRRAGQGEVLDEEGNLAFLCAEIPSALLHTIRKLLQILQCKKKKSGVRHKDVVMGWFAAVEKNKNWPIRISQMLQGFAKAGHLELPPNLRAAFADVCWSIILEAIEKKREERNRRQDSAGVEDSSVPAQQPAQATQDEQEEGGAGNSVDSAGEAPPEPPEHQPPQRPSLREILVLESEKGSSLAVKLANSNDGFSTQKLCDYYRVVTGNSGKEENAGASDNARSSSGTATRPKALLSSSSGAPASKEPLSQPNRSFASSTLPVPALRSRQGAVTPGEAGLMDAGAAEFDKPLLVAQQHLDVSRETIARFATASSRPNQVSNRDLTMILSAGEKCNEAAMTVILSTSGTKKKDRAAAFQLMEESRRQSLELLALLEGGKAPQEQQQQQ